MSKWESVFVRLSSMTDVKIAIAISAGYRGDAVPNDSGSKSCGVERLQRNNL